MKHFDKIIGLIGFGAVGKLLYSTLLDNKFKPEQIFIFDDKIDAVKNSKCFKFNEFKKFNSDNIWFIPTLGYLSAKLRLSIINYLLENDKNIFSYYHPSAFISPSTKIGHGVLIYSMVNIDAGVEIGDEVIIANSTTIAHDVIIKNGVYFGANAYVCGEVTIGELCFIGSSSTISNGLKIGNHCTIGMSSCITKNIPDNSFAIGNPFKLKKQIKLT